ncbi:hypothetical protein FQN60_001365 [Etheostoma spectabile]|uniref:VWFA domain-containing protein n=1 Tax=Etheostoma spectabile TaxID=54343 RepID=A0A5J5D995_9PERO|nr:hypothetical protein FQN60_001365 [Etheostoma spectabile]
MATPQRNAENFMKVEGNTTLPMDIVRESLEKLRSISANDATETGMLRSRIDEQSSLICMLKERADEVLLRCQALQNINTELESRVTDCQTELDSERKKAELLEKRFMDLAANNQAIIAFMEEYKTLKLNLQNAEEEHAFKETKMRESTTSLTIEKDKLLCLSIERGKIIQEKQEEIQQLETKWKKEKKARTEAEDRFEQEAETVNADVKVKSLQSALYESMTKYEKLKKRHQLSHVASKDFCYLEGLQQETLDLTSTSYSLRGHRDPDGGSSIQNLLTADQTLCAIHGDHPNCTLCHLQHQPALTASHLRCIKNRRQAFIKLGMNHSTNHSHYLAVGQKLKYYKSQHFQRRLDFGIKMFPSSTLVLLLTALTSVWAQEFYEEKKTDIKSRSNPLVANTHNGQAILGEDCSLELSFLLDSSESAKDNHEQEKQFIMNLVDRLQGVRLQTGRSFSLRVALLQYSSHVITEQTFRDWRGRENFKTRVAPIIYIGHGTYTTYAITNMTKIYQEESSPGSIKVAMLFTDGISHPRNPDIFSAVADAKNQGIKFFTLGITRAANEPANVAHLRLLASSPATRFLHNLQDGDIVEKIVPEITSLADEGCPVAQGCACEKGERGPSGPAGKKGRPGDDGAPGLRGQKGEAGLSGLPGREGAEGKPGYKGEQGERGECGTPGIKGDRVQQVLRVQLEQEDLEVYRGYQDHMETLEQRAHRESRVTVVHLAPQGFRGRLVLDFLDQKVTWDSRVDQVLLVPMVWASLASLDLKDHRVFKGKKDPMARGFPDQRYYFESISEKSSNQSRVTWGLQVLLGQLD